MNIKPYKIYKGLSGKWGALQLDLIPIENSRRDLGTVLITFANPKLNRTYDWDHKVIMALNLSDIATILEFLSSAEFGGVTSIFHDPNAGTSESGQQEKKLTLAKGNEHGWFLGVSYRSSSGASTEVRVPVKDGEMIVIKTLLQHAIPRILGW